MTFESLKGKRMRQQWRARRAEAPGQSRVYVAAEVGWCCGVADLERQHRRLIPTENQCSLRSSGLASDRLGA